MNNIIKLIIIETIILLVLLMVLFIPKSKKIANICFQQHCFSVEVADTFLKQQKGLMFRENLPKNEGMLFIFKEEANYPFWMKNTYIPLDIIWVNGNGEVVFIKENAQACKETCDPINPQQNALYVLEINGGISREINLTLGDTAKIYK